MIKHWTVFEGVQNGKRREKARITLNKHRTILMNAHAWHAVGEPSAVEFMFDGNRNMIGVKPCDPHKKNAFEVKRRLQGKHFSIAAGSFLTHFKIRPEHTVLFEQIDIDPDGILTLDMTKTTVVTRGSR